MQCPTSSSTPTRRSRPHRGWLYLAFALVLLVFTAALPAACGEATEDPDDCRPGEFFDEANERCTACPAVSQPECEPGCGFEVTDDTRGCPALVCAQPCRCSEPDQFFSDETLSCEDCAAVTDPPAICFEDNQQDDE